MELRPRLTGALLVLSACGDPFTAPGPIEAPEIVVEPELEAGISLAPRVRLFARFGKGVAPGELSLFASELSESQLARIRRGDVPSTLAALELPALAWVAPSGETVVRPTRLLTPGAVLSLVSKSFGRLAIFDVAGSPEQRPLVRRWPPPGIGGARLAVLCGESAPSNAWSFSLEPGGDRALLEPEYGSWEGARCVAVRFESLPEELALLPPEIEGHALDPEPLFAEPEPELPLPEAACAPHALRLGPLCAEAEDDRLVISGADRALLVRAFRSGAAELLPIAPGGTLALRGFSPDSEQTLSGEVITLEGEERGFDVTFRTAPARERWVLNEVLSNPLGPEPAQEWVEIVNAGSVRASLAGLGLEDGGGRIELPEVSAEPGQFIVLVREDFSPAFGDVAPAPSALLVQLPALAKNGLSNSGEPLRLVGGDGRVVTAFPALAARRAGVSLARRSLERADSDPEAFAEHAAPGASPGAPNLF